MTNGGNFNDTRCVINQIEIPVGASMGRVGRSERGIQWFSHAAWIVEQGPIDELKSGECHFFGQDIGE
jgi:hypothetical protein